MWHCAGFHELVEEYTRLVERLEDRQWTMKVKRVTSDKCMRARCTHVFILIGSRKPSNTLQP